MLGTASPATPSLHTSTSSATSTAPSRPGRLRGLSYLRSHLNAARSDASTLTRPTSSLAGNNASAGTKQEEATSAAPIALGEQGRSGLHRESVLPAPSGLDGGAPDGASSDNSANMGRSRAVTTHASTPALSDRASLLPGRQRSTAAMDGTPATRSSTSGPSPSSTILGREAPSIRFIPHLETRSSRPALHFSAVTRALPSPGSVVRVGRYSEREHASSDPSILPVGFKSKVVSRRHCEFWCTDGQWYVKDVKSSSGTFLNHVRLSAPGAESRPFPVKDGDVIQLGIDFKGGEEVIFRCVKMRVEVNRGWQKAPNAYNTSTHERLLRQARGATAAAPNRARDSDAQSVNGSECSICLNPVAPCQALFVAPCSHVWHYKCIKDLIQAPNFLCPNCRFVADLDADVEPPEEPADERAKTMRTEEERRTSEVEHVAEERRLPSDGDDDVDHDRAQDGASQPHRPADESTAEDDNSDLDTSARAAHANLQADAPGSAADTSTSHGSGDRNQLLRPSTPQPTTSFMLPIIPGAEGPLTPRNDAGPFVFDGAAGRQGMVDGDSEPRFDTAEDER